MKESRIQSWTGLGDDNRLPLKCRFPLEIGRSQAPRRQQAAAARRRRKFVSGQFDEENPFVLISSVLLVQANEGVSFFVMDRIGDIYCNLPRRADVIVTTVGARHKCQQGSGFEAPILAGGADPDPQQWYQSQCFSDLINTILPELYLTLNFQNRKGQNSGDNHRPPPRAAAPPPRAHMNARDLRAGRERNTRQGCASSRERAGRA
ncbi:hypothetical protein F511_20549 [Dorcoceras hygrometricum]|uniref:Uncharacterized protein n=1 Tax=Dorcoceras hygrometricum TaxID=472368 RepID=A0A2Z7BRA5_9LAMI|nr:hypothetical protein F511_20549 [Dorcoceras hygrometricum]